MRVGGRGQYVAGMTSGTRLLKVTPDNVQDACALRVRPDQERFVAPVAKSLAEAYVMPEIAWPRLIVDGDQPVGFLMGFFGVHFSADAPDVFRSGLWRLNIAAGQQGRGYGTFAVEALCAEIRERGQTRATTTYEPGEGGPEPFYLRLGFRPTGEHSGGETVATRDLTAPR